MPAPARSRRIETTHAIRWIDGAFHVYLCWFHWQTQQWTSYPAPYGQRYGTLAGAIRSLRKSDCIMLFPAA